MCGCKLPDKEGEACRTVHGQKKYRSDEQNKPGKWRCTEKKALNDSTVAGAEARSEASNGWLNCPRWSSQWSFEWLTEQCPPLKLGVKLQMTASTVSGAEAWSEASNDWLNSVRSEALNFTITDLHRSRSHMADLQGRTAIVFKSATTSLLHLFLR